MFAKQSPLLTDFYELTMAAAYYSSLYHTKTKMKGVFEMFVRAPPRNRSYIVTAGLAQVIEYILHLRFTDDEIGYLESLPIMNEIGKDFFENYLRKFKFTGNIWAVPEGTILFPNEPLLRVEAPIIEAQIIETYVLSMINFQSLIATKASRLVAAAKGRPIVEFGSRRAHGPQAAFLAARAAYIGGCIGTSNTLAGHKFGIPVFGTMAHSYVMSFVKEEEAFLNFNGLFPAGYLLVDTYDTIKAVNKIIKLGLRPVGIRLDSGDLYSLSTESRRLLDEGGCTNTKIMASGDLNEFKIRDLINSNAPIDFYGVGTELSTSRDDPAMNGVYKLVAVKIKQIQEHTVSSKENIIVQSQDRGNKQTRVEHHTLTLCKVKTSTGKKTYPGIKQIYRIFEKNDAKDNDTVRKIKQDIITLDNGNGDDKTANNSIPLLKNCVKNGKLISELPTVHNIAKYHLEQYESLPNSFKNLDFIPTQYPVTYDDSMEALLKELKFE
jgi:nicotinate phosphoribosyltransferase